MLKSQARSDMKSVKVTFALPLAEWSEAVSVVGDFNGWDPYAHPLRRRSNGTRSVTIELPTSAAFEFRYLADGGAWFGEPQAGMAAANSVLHT